MSRRYYREASRGQWYRDGTISDDCLKTGALMRIADATELMAQSHQQLVEERDRYKRWHEQERTEARYLRRSNAGLRGVITRMKRKVARL